MLSEKKSCLKKVLMTIIISLIAFSAISMTATKIIYDNIFARRDGKYTETPIQLEQMVNSRKENEYPSGENLLAGYFYPCENENKKDTLVVIAPGFNAGADSYLWQIKSLLDYGWSVFAFDATGSFQSEGDSSVGFSQELCDIRATLDYIEESDRFGYKDIALLGHSIGGYAVCCALRYEYKISAVVSISGVNSAMEGVISSSANYVGYFAYGNYGFLWLYQTMLFGADVVNMSASDEISQSDTPVLIVHGSEDNLFPDDKYSIISHRDEITSSQVEYLVCSTDEQNGHTSLLFDSDGTANKQLMSEINDFLIRSTK